MRGRPRGARRPLEDPEKTLLVRFCSEEANVATVHGSQVLEVRSDLVIHFIIAWEKQQAESSAIRPMRLIAGRNKAIWRGWSFLVYPTKRAGLFLFSEHRCRIGHVGQRQHLIVRIIVHGCHGEEQIKLLVGLHFVNPRAAMLADQVVAAFELSIGFKLLAVVWLFGDCLDELGAGPSDILPLEHEKFHGASFTGDYTGYCS